MGKRFRFQNLFGGVCSGRKSDQVPPRPRPAQRTENRTFHSPRMHGNAPVVWKGRLSPPAGPWQVWGAERPQIPEWAPYQYLAPNNADVGLILFKDLSVYSWGAQMVQSGAST